MDDHLYQFNSKILTVFDAIAHVKVKMISGKQKALWGNATEVANQKRGCRKAECKWRKSNPQIDYDILKERIHTCNSELKRGRRFYFSNIINGNVNISRNLLSTVDIYRLPNPLRSYL